MRDLNKIVARIKALPGTEKAHIRLDNVMRCAKYVAPELQYTVWGQIAYVLQDTIPDHKEAKQIFNDEER